MSARVSPGLYSQIKRNNRRSAFIILGFFVVFFLAQLSLGIGGALSLSDRLLEERRVLEQRHGKPARQIKEEQVDNYLKRCSPTSLLGTCPRTKTAAEYKRDALAEFDRGLPTTIPEAIVHLLQQPSFVQRLTWMMVAAFGWVAIATWFNTVYVRLSTSARPIDRREFPELYNVVENLCMTVGMPCPAIELIESDQLNAYASGLTPRTARLGLTTGLVENLTRNELEAVIAHELTHIRNGDARFMALAKACFDLTMVPIRMLCRLVADNRIVLIAFVIGLAFYGPALFGSPLLWVILGAGGLMALMFKSSVATSREFIADAGAIEITKNPAALIAALSKIADHDDIHVNGVATRAMLFSNNDGHWFGSHPSIQERIDAIAALALVQTHEVVAAFRDRSSTGQLGVMTPTGHRFGTEPSFGRRGRDQSRIANPARSLRTIEPKSQSVGHRHFDPLGRMAATGECAKPWGGAKPQRTKTATSSGRRSLAISKRNAAKSDEE
ncbi:MAG: M48 family metalloprotease [Pseudomonadota bacterium]